MAPKRHSQHGRKVTLPTCIQPHIHEASPWCQPPHQEVPLTALCLLCACLLLLQYPLSESEYTGKGAQVPGVLPTLRGKPEVVGKTALPGWMMYKEVDPKDASVAGWMQRVKNTLFGGLQADIFEVGGEGWKGRLGEKGVTDRDALATSHVPVQPGLERAFKPTKALQSAQPGRTCQCTEHCHGLTRCVRSV